MKKEFTFCLWTHNWKLPVVTCMHISKYRMEHTTVSGKDHSIFSGQTNISLWLCSISHIL